MKKLNKYLSSLLVTMLFFAIIPVSTVGQVVDTQSKSNNVLSKQITEEGEIVEFKVGRLNDSMIAPRIYIPNSLVGTITPYSTYYSLTINNIGVDAIDSVSLFIDLYDNITGEKLDSTTKNYKKLKVGTTTFKWYKSKSNTVEERITVSLVGNDGGQALAGTSATVRWNFEGGAYGRISAYGGEVHHCPADAINGLTKYSGPAIRMLKDDHRKTASCGSSNEAKKYRDKQEELINKGKFAEAMQMDVDDIKDTFGSKKYSKAINQMIDYAEKKGYISKGSVK